MDRTLVKDALADVPAGMIWVRKLGQQVVQELKAAQDKGPEF